MTVPGTPKRLTHGAKRMQKSTRRLEREEQGETRKETDRAPLLFILLDNGDRPVRSPIDLPARDHILVPKWKLSIVHRLVGQWAAACYGNLL